MECTANWWNISHHINFYQINNMGSDRIDALEIMDRNINYKNENLCPVNIYLDLSTAFNSL